MYISERLAVEIDIHPILKKMYHTKIREIQCPFFMVRHNNQQSASLNIVPEQPGGPGSSILGASGYNFIQSLDY